ncbi:MAG: DUF4279 domain-containing protein [Planctomycetaceae bacterium]
MIERPDTSTPRISCYFRIGGHDFDPATVTGALGLDPDTIWHKREGLKYRTDIPSIVWSIGFTKQPFYSTSDALEELFLKIWPARVRIRDFLAESGLEGLFTCNITISEDRPLYELTPSVIEKLAFFGCEFLMDIFDYSE